MELQTAGEGFHIRAYRLSLAVYGFIAAGAGDGTGGGVKMRVGSVSGVLCSNM